MSKLVRIHGCDNPHRRADVVFVHGLGGDAGSTWRHSDSATDSFPHWLAADFPDTGIWALDYPASRSKWPQFLGWFSDEFKNSGQGIALAARGGQVLNQLALNGLGDRPLFFIVHSLGGLVVK